MVPIREAEDSPYAVRNYRSDDIDGYVWLRAAAAGEASDLSENTLRECLGRPGYSPDRDLFLAVLGGRVVGYLDTTLERGIRRAVLECLVHPDHRRRGLGTELFRHALGRAAEAGAGIAHVNAAGDNVVASSFLSRLAFKPVRRYLEMRLDLVRAGLPVTSPGDVLCRSLRPGEEDKLADIQNRAFEGSWGFNPNTVEEVAYRLNMSDTSPQQVSLAVREDAILGYCWTTADPAAPGGQRTGRVHMVGVSPESRGRGIGRQALVAGLGKLKQAGVEVVKLSVDSRNGSAIALYESIGFGTESTTVWYEREVASGG